MHRILIALAVVVGLCALGAVGFVIHKSMTASQPAVVAPSDEPAVAVDTAKPAPRAVRPRVARNAPVVADASSVTPAEATVLSTTSGTGSLDVTAFLNSLTPDEEKALGMAMMGRFMQKRTQDRRYQAPASKLNRLDRVDPKLALTPAQQTQLNAVMQGLKPQMDATFKDVWAKQDQLGGQMRQIFGSATDPEQARQQTQALRQQMDALNATMQPQQDAFSQQVMAAMTPYLTPEQIQAVNTMPAQTDRGGFDGPGGGGPPNGPGGGRPERRNGRGGNGGGAAPSN